MHTFVDSYTTYAAQIYFVNTKLGFCFLYSQFFIKAILW